jgi:hypothetical protein
MYTLEQVERVAVQVFAGVTDPQDAASKRRMEVITDLFGSMLASKTRSVDSDTLDDGTRRLLDHYLAEGAA